MRGYERILEGTSHGGPGAQGAHEEGGAGIELRGAEGRDHGGEARRRNIVAVSIGALTVLGVLLGLSGTASITKDELARQEEQQQQDDVAADLSSKHHHHGHHGHYGDAFVSVFESSLYTGARLDQGFPSPAGLKEECFNPSNDGDDSDNDSSGDSDDSNDDDDGDGGGGGAVMIAPCPGKGRGTVLVESDEKLQKMVGFGGAFTDAATINFYKLPTDIQDKVMDAYFGPNGIEYTVGRIPMGSCDFSVEEYSFDDVPGDYNLTHFDDGVEKDSAQRIPMILEALKRQEGLQLFISPWSPPAWMKVPLDGVQSMIRSAAPQGLLPDPRVHAAWALFFSKFITAYKEQGVDMWGLTIQNESENCGPWEACAYTPSSQADFVRDYLGPVMRRDHPDVKIIAFDHNRDHLVKWTEEMVRDEETSQYIDGMGFHWYFASGERLLDGSTGWGDLNTTHNLLNDDQFILSTESCNCPNVQHSLEGGWKRAEHVAHDMIADVNSWSVGWVDWNLMLNYDGGPNHLGNLCDSPIAADKNHTDVTFQPMFYFLGHMSKFAQPGARRLKSHVTGSYKKGGMGPSTVVPGYEATVYGCESSVRQSWELSATGKISLADHYGAQYDWFSPMCISKELSASSHSVSLVPCDSDQAGTYIHDPENLHLVLQTDDSDPPDAYTAVVPDAEAGPGELPLNGSESGAGPTTAPAAAALCLGVLGESVDDGALLTLAPCVNEKGEGSQSWEFSTGGGDAGDGSLVSLSTGQCVTAGWPFFTGAAFEMSEESRERYGKDFAVVLLNEAEEPVEFDLSFPSEGFTVRVAIGGRSIQTILA